MVTLHWSIFVAIVMFAAMVGWFVCALITIASNADERIREMKK